MRTIVAFAAAAIALASVIRLTPAIASEYGAVCEIKGETLVCPEGWRSQIFVPAPPLPYLRLTIEPRELPSDRCYTVTDSTGAVYRVCQDPPQ